MQRDPLNCAHKRTNAHTHNTHTHTHTHTHKYHMQHSLSQRVQSELLCLASSLLGQSLVASAAGNMATTRRALEAFLDSARYTLYIQSLNGIPIVY